ASRRSWAARRNMPAALSSVARPRNPSFQPPRRSAGLSSGPLWRFSGERCANNLIREAFADSVPPMAKRGRNAFEMIRQAALPALALLIIANFLGYAIVGSNGILSWGDYRRQKQAKQVELASLNVERAKL